MGQELGIQKAKGDQRRHRRIDTTNGETWKIRVFGVQGKPLEGRIINLSLGGVAFVTHWRHVAKAVKKPNTKIEIQLPDGISVNASTTLVRVRPNIQNDECICVLALSGLNRTSTSRLKNFIPN